MSEPAQGPVTTNILGADFTAEVAAAKAAGEAAMAAQTATLAAAPGVGALLDLPDNGLGNDVRGWPPGPGGTPRVGEGLGAAAPAAPAQTDHARPSYAGPLAGDEDPFLGGQ